MSRPLRGLPLACIDTETTGLDTATARIVDVAVVHVNIGDTAAKVAYSSFVNPGIPIPPDSTRITGITDDDVRDAPGWAMVAPEVFEACRGRLVVAYNVPYDYPLILAESARHGVDLPWPFPWLDLLVVRKAMKRGRPGTLVEVAREYGICLDAHGAAGDALATAMIATPMLRQAHPIIGARDEDALMAWQRTAAIAQEADYADYCQRQGHARPPRMGWHELLGVAGPEWQAPTLTRITKRGEQA